MSNTITTKQKIATLRKNISPKTFEGFYECEICMECLAETTKKGISKAIAFHTETQINNAYNTLIAYLAI